MKITEINSINASELDVYIRYTENQLRNRLDPENAIFIAESDSEVFPIYMVLMTKTDILYITSKKEELP